MKEIFICRSLLPFHSYYIDRTIPEFKASFRQSNWDVYIFEFEMAIKFVDSILKLSAIHKVRHSLFKQHVFLLAICFYCKFFHLLPMVVVAHLHFIYSIESISNKRAWVSYHICHLQYVYSVTLDVIKVESIGSMMKKVAT